MNKEYPVLSLFSSAGIGELGIRTTGFPILVSNEMDVRYIEKITLGCIIFVEIFGKKKMKLFKLGICIVPVSHLLFMQLRPVRECHQMGQENYCMR